MNGRNTEHNTVKITIRPFGHGFMFLDHSVDLLFPLKLPSTAPAAESPYRPSYQYISLSDISLTSRIATRDGCKLARALDFLVVSRPSVDATSCPFETPVASRLQVRGELITFSVAGDATVLITPMRSVS